MNNDYNLDGIDLDKSVEIPLKKKKLTVFEKMREIAKRADIILKDPKSNCKKCLGKGYQGFHYDPKNPDIPQDKKVPIPCSCVIPKEVYRSAPLRKNYKERRKERLWMERENKRLTKQFKKM